MTLTPTVTPTGTRPRATGGSFVAERKRGNGEGGKPRKRPDGRWEARYWKDGKRKSVYAATRKEVADKLRDAISTKDDVPAFEATNITVAEFLGQYEEAAKYTMKRRSFETYRDIARKHLLPALGNTKLKDLSREQVQRLYSRKREQGLSTARVRRIHGVLSAALNKGVLWRMVPHNVCKEVSPPRVEAPEIKPLTKEQAKRFLAAAEVDRYHALFVLGLTTGMRFGELAGLSWESLDLEARTMRVTRTLVTGYGGQSFDSPKTTGSRRTVTLTTKAIAALMSHRERQQVAGIPVDADALVFTNQSGGPMNHSHFTRRNFKPLLKRAGLPDASFHAATRHTCCCLLLMAGVNAKAVSLQLGHSSVAFTLQKYAHYMPGMGDAAASAMDEALG